MSGCRYFNQAGTGADEGQVSVWGCQSIFAGYQAQRSQRCWEQRWDPQTDLIFANKRSSRLKENQNNNRAENQLFRR